VLVVVVGAPRGLLHVGTTVFTSCVCCTSAEEYAEYTMDKIINGCGEVFPGLVGLIEVYLNMLDMSKPELPKITPATWTRDFVQSHPSYKFDSVVSKEINYDLMMTVDKIERSVHRAPDLLSEDYMGTEQDSAPLPAQ